MQYKRNSWEAILILCSFCFTALFGQTLPYKTIGLKDGLPQSSVNRLVQDNQGYMWLATQGGLCRYDGMNFTTYSMYDGIGSQFIMNIEFDEKGQLWMSTLENGIACFTGKKFINYNRKSGFVSDQIRYFKKSKSNDYFICSIDSGIVWVDEYRRQKIIRTPENEIVLYARDILELPNGNIWVGWNNGIIELDKSKKYSAQHILKNDFDIISLYEDSKGNIWAGGTKSLWEFRKDTIINYAGKLTPYTEVNDILEDPATGIIYFATSTGLLIKKGENYNWLNTENGLSVDYIRTLKRDITGHIWLGSFGGGAMILNDKGIDHFGGNGESAGFAVNTMVEDKEGNIWIGTNNNGIVMTDGSSCSKVESISSEEMDIAISSTSNTLTGDIYFAKYEGKIIKIRDKKIVWRWASNSIQQTRILSIHWHKDVLYVCTQSGVFTLSEKDNVLKPIQELGNIYCTYAFTDNLGYVWFSCDPGRIFRWNGREIKEFTKIINPSLTTVGQGLQSKKYGLYFFCTNSGLIVWNGKTTYKLHSKNGIQSDAPWSLTEDKLGNIWMGHCNGIEYIDIAHKKSRFIGYEQGFTPIETNSCAALCDRDGNVWFGTVNTATRVRVKDIKPKKSIVNLWIQKIEVNEEKYFEQDLLHDKIETVKQPYYKNNIFIDLMAISFDNSKDVQYSWFMENVDEKWTFYSTEKRVIYSNLKPGSYLFTAKAKDPSGFETTPIQIRIIISKPIWNKWWFYALEVLVMLIIIFLSFRFSSHSSQNKLGNLLTLVSILIIFEGLLIYVSDYVNQFTGGVPIFQLIMNVILAGTLHPLEQFIRKFMRKWAIKKKKKNKLVSSIAKENE